MVEHSETFLGKMERRRKSNRRFLQTMHTLLPPVLLVTQLSLHLLAFCSLFLLVDYAECIMTFPDDSGVYSLFPDEDLKTGRKRLRFDEETTIRNYRDGRDFLVRSYPMLPQDRFHRPVDFSGGSGSGSRPPPIYDDFRDRERDRHRQGRVYFDDRFRTSRFDFHRLTPRPRPIERPVNPIIFETSRRPPPLHHQYPFHDGFPPGPPAIGQSKLPPGASSRASGEDVPPTRIHVFNPESNSFGNPRNAGRGGDDNDGPPPSSSSVERAKGPPSNFVETGPPGPESFLNHDEFLEYQKKIAFSRFHEQDASGNGGSSTGGGGGGSGKKVLFESKEPFEIDGLIPPDKSGEISGKLPTPTTSKAPIKPSIQEHQPRHQQHFVPQPDQRQLQRSQQQQQHNHHQQNHGEGQKSRTSGGKTRHSHNADEEAEEERDTGGGEVESDIVHEKGDEVESENGKSEVTQLPPTHITKSGRAYNKHHHPQQHQQPHQGSSSSASASEHSSRSIGSKKFTPSISHNEDTGSGGTGFKLPTTAVSYSDEPPNLNGFVPVVPFHLIGGAEQPRAISLERPRQQQQNRIVPHHHHHEPVYSTTATTTTTSSSTTTPRSIPFTTTYSTTITPTIRSKGEKSVGGFRPSTEVTKSFTPTPSSSTSSPFSDDNTGNNAGSSGGGAGSPASPILHATAGERSNSETHSKVAITKQQELKRLQKQRQLTSSMHNQHQLVQITPPSSAHSSYSSSSSAGLFPDIGLSDSSSSSADSADNSDNHNNPGIFTNPIIYSKNSHFLDEEIMVMAPQQPKVPEDNSLHTHHPTLPTPTQHLYHQQDTILNIYPPSSSSISSEQNIHSEHKTQYSSNNNDTHFQIQTIRHNIPSTLKDNTIDIKSQSQEHNSVTQLGDDETLNIVKSVSDSEKNTNPNPTNNEILDTRAVKIANGIKQGEFLLEGYMINSNEDGGGGGSNSPSFNGGGSNSLSSRSSSSADADYINNNININEENTSSIPHRHYGLYDYPDHNTPEDNLPTTLLRKNEDEQGIVDTYSSPIIPPVEKIDEDGSYNDQDNIPLSPVVIPLLPGTTTPDLEQKVINMTPTPYLYNESSKNSPTGSGSSTYSEQRSSTNEDVTGNDYFSKSIGSNEPSVDVEDEPRHNMSPAVVVDDDVVHHVAKSFESEPTPPPELRRTRLSEINEEDNFASNVDAIVPTNPIYNTNDFIDNSVAYFPYYDTYGNKINITNKSSGSSASNSLLEDSNTSDKISRDDGDGGGGGDDENFNLSSSGEGSAESIHQDRSLSSASSSSSSSSSSSHANENSSNIVKLSITNHANTNNFVDDNHSSISVPVEASLKYDSVPNFSGSSSTNDFGNSIDDLSSSISFNNDNTPLYLESSETLMNKTYYLDGNFNSIHHQSTTNKKNGSNNSLKSSNFIKVTRIKTSSGPTSHETAEKTSSTILARSRTSKPAVIVSTSAAGIRPKVVGSVVEAGPAWPGLVSNFLRNNGYNHNHNRSFTATATVRPRGNSGNNPAPPPTTIITSQITHAQVHQQPQQQQIHHHRKQSPHVPLPLPPAQKLHQEPPTTVKPTEFQLHQIRIPTVSTISSGFISTKNSNANPSSSPNNNESKNRIPANNHNHQKTNNSSSGIIINRSSANNNLAKQVNSIVNANTNNQNSNQQQLHNYNSTHAIVRRLYSSEEVASSSNSSTGVVQKIHAHISHCPKLHSPTEVICDVHIRQGHGVPNPQLTVGWRRKFYNSTQPDVLLALNKAPASGENGHFDPHHSIVELEPGKNDERLEEFHDRFNVTLAPGISPMLRSVLLIRSVTAPDCGTYQCEVNDGINVLRSETLLFLCH